MIVQADKYAILRKYWGFSQFRGDQSEIIDAVLAGKDTLALMATGGGKSMCYQLPALLKDGICIVISPLIALMEDQERSIRERGITAESVHSGKSKKRQDEILDNCIYGDVKFLFLSPEKLQSKVAIARIAQMKVSFFAIDEAHCISQWGHDFRPNYLKLNVIREHFGGKSILALTATATTNVVDDIVKYLEFEDGYKVFKSSFSRKNISISVTRTLRKQQRIKQIVSKVKGSKIIYARNKRHCSEINQSLLNMGIKSAVYHADVPMKQRQERQEAWIRNELECVVCTSAFGMGIDKPDVRLVIHYDLPPSLEEYIQEIGRAGRDGQLSFAVLLYNNYDLQELEFHYVQGRPTIARIKEIYHELGTFLRVPIDDGQGLSFGLSSEAFLERVVSNKVELKAALQTLEKNEYIAISSSFFTSDKLQIIAGKSVLNQFLQESTDIAKLVQYLLRNYEGLLYSFVSVSFESIQRKYQWSKKHLLNVIDQAMKQDIVLYIHDDGSEKVTYLKNRLSKANLFIDRRELKNFYSAKKDRYEAVVSYIIKEDCRAYQLLEYFDEYAKEPCGICDYCKGVYNDSFNKQEFNDARHQILAALTSKALQMDDLLAISPWNKQAKFKAILKRLLEDDEVKFERNYFKLPKDK